MITRSKVGVFKPKSFVSALIEKLFTTLSATKQALSNPLWKQLMILECNALIKNKTWILVQPTYDRKVIRSKWIFQIKKLMDGTLDRRKSQVVA